MKRLNKMLLLVFIVSLFFIPKNVKAEYNAKVMYKTESPSCELYPGYSGKCLYQDANLNSIGGYCYILDPSDEVTVYDEDTVPSTDPNKCGDYYVKVSYAYPTNPWKITIGYFCHEDLKSDYLTDELKEEFRQAGFPESYWDKLAALKTSHPNWTFKVADTKLDWNAAVDAEYRDDITRNLMQVIDSPGYKVNDFGYLNTESSRAYNYYTDTYTPFDGSNWYSANRNSVAFYMDPRNFLTDVYVFQFEALAYDNSVSDENLASAINKIFTGDYLSKFVNEFIAAGKESGVSPVFLASLSKQEVGGNGMIPNTAISGNPFTYGDVSAEHIYNFFNIGATGGPGAVERGLVYAYYAGWDTEAKAITGGAQFIGNDYVSIGQNTSYFKKWDVVSNLNAASGTNYVHQYMQNIQAPTSEAESVYRSYSQNGMLDSNFVFYIPVYNNMPENTSLSKNGNQNNYLKSLSINGNKIAEFDGGKFEYEYKLDININKIKIDVEKVAATSTVTGAKEYDINSDITIPITVKAQNGAERVYKINIKRVGTLNDNPVTVPKTIQEVLNNAGIKNGELYLSGIAIGSQDNYIIDKVKNIDPTATISITKNDPNRKVLATGDKVKFVVGTDVREYTVVMYGDTNGDGKISAVDYAKVKNHVLKLITLDGAYLKASDASKDSKISAVDYAIIKNTVLGNRTIEQ